MDGLKLSVLVSWGNCDEFSGQALPGPKIPRAEGTTMPDASLKGKDVLTRRPAKTDEDAQGCPDLSGVLQSLRDSVDGREKRREQRVVCRASVAPSS